MMNEPVLTADSERIPLGNIAVAALWAIVASVVINLVIRILAVSLLDISEEFQPLGWGPPVIFTVIGVIGAGIVFAIISRFSSRPGRLFTIIAIVVLLVSFIPDILLLTTDPTEFPGVSLGAVAALMLMHIPPAFFSIYFFSRLSEPVG